MPPEPDSIPSNILVESPSTAPPSAKGLNRRFLAQLVDSESIVNLAGNYSYLEEGYYTSLDLQVEGSTVHPTCKESLDAYVTPVMLEKAKLNGIPIPEWYITNGYFEPPVIIDSINPFMTRHSIVEKSGHVDRVAKSMTRNFKYAICCQEIPDGAKIGTFRTVLGWSATPANRQLAEAIWSVFKIPLSIVRVVQLVDGTVLLSDINPLPFTELNDRERMVIQKRVRRWLI